MYVCVNICVYVCVNTCVYACEYMCVCLCEYMCVCLCEYMCVDTWYICLCTKSDIDIELLPFSAKTDDFVDSCTMLCLQRHLVTLADQCGGTLSNSIAFHSTVSIQVNVSFRETCSLYVFRVVFMFLQCSINVFHVSCCRYWVRYGWYLVYVWRIIVIF